MEEEGYKGEYWRYTWSKYVTCIYEIPHWIIILKWGKGSIYQEERIKRKPAANQSKNKKSRKWMKQQKYFLQESIQLKQRFQDWQRERKQMTNIKNEKRDVNTTLDDAKRKTKWISKTILTNNFDNLNEILNTNNHKPSLGVTHQVTYLLGTYISN